jgi:hypothetical protein
MKDLSTPTFLAIAGLVMIAGVLLLLFFTAVPTANASALNIVLGALIGWMGSTYQFYYGSTKTSQTKDDTIASLTTAATGTGTGTTTTVTTETKPTEGKTT